MHYEKSVRGDLGSGLYKQEIPEHMAETFP